MYEERTSMIPASSLVVTSTRDMVATVAFVFRIVASSAHGGKPFCSDSSGCVWFEASDTDGSVLKRNVYVCPRLKSTRNKFFLAKAFLHCSQQQRKVRWFDLCVLPCYCLLVFDRYVPFSFLMIVQQRWTESHLFDSASTSTP